MSTQEMRVKSAPRNGRPPRALLSAAEEARAERTREVLEHVSQRLSLVQARLDQRRAGAERFLQELPHALLEALTRGDDEEIVRLHEKRADANRALQNAEHVMPLMTAYRRKIANITKGLADYWSIPGDPDALFPSFLTEGLPRVEVARTEAPSPKGRAMSIPTATQISPVESTPTDKGAKPLHSGGFSFTGMKAWP